MTGRVTLRKLWMQHFSERVTPGARCDVGGCVSEVVHQTFLECEPSVLILKVCRAGSNEAGLDTKWNGLVDFPEEIDFMRSGKYTFCGLVRHHGLSPNDGHYDAYCVVDPDRLDVQGNSFGYFNDFECKRVGWNQLATAATKKSVYILVYSRKCFWCDDLSGGTAAVPYARGDDSAKQSQMPVKA